jgi:hypothetical protein
MATRICAVFGLLLVGGLALFAQQPSPPPPRTLVWVDRSGAEQPLNATPQVYSDPRISP